jgi:hypothetical protein
MLSEHIATGQQPDAPSKLTKFFNCRILRDHKIIKEDLWVREGKIINPEKVFFDEKKQAHLVRHFMRFYQSKKK